MLRLHFRQTRRRNHADDRTSVRVGLQEILGDFRQRLGVSKESHDNPAENQEIGARKQHLQTKTFGYFAFQQHQTGTGSVLEEARDEEHPRGSPRDECQFERQLRTSERNRQETGRF